MKIIDKRDRHMSGSGAIGSPGRSSHFVSRQLCCPNCGSVIKTTRKDNYSDHCTLCEVGGTRGNIWIAICPNCGYDKLAFFDKHGN